jgi:dephospho-CoA kinase
VGQWPNKYVIGLTGNLAMGKSLVRRMLEHLGAYTIDAGGLAYQAMAPGAPAYKPVIQTFGTWIVDAEKRVDRAKLAAVSFSHPQALTRLQALTQPIVGRAIDTLIGRAKHNIAVVEAIDLLEGDLADKVDAIWVVNTSVDNQVARLVKDGLSEWEARKRIELQNPQQAKLDRAAVVIQNDGTPEEVWKLVQAEWEKLNATLGHAEAEEAPARTIAVEKQDAPAAGLMDISEVTIKRGTPRNAEEIAAMQTRLTHNDVSRMDVMMAFGQKSYLLAQANDQNVGLVGFQVENLITRVDEFLIIPEALHQAVINGLIDAVEESSRELQSEIGFFFLPDELPQHVIEIFTGRDYVPRTLEQIKVPAWREAARDSQPEGTAIYARKLREERVLKPL